MEWTIVRTTPLPACGLAVSSRLATRISTTEHSTRACLSCSPRIGPAPDCTHVGVHASCIRRIHPLSFTFFSCIISFNIKKEYSVEIVKCIARLYCTSCRFLSVSHLAHLLLLGRIRSTQPLRRFDSACWLQV